MNKLIATAAAFSIICAALPNAVLAANSGSCGETAKWSYENNTLTITGEGAIKDGKQEWSKLVSDIKVINIGEGITSIGASAFGGCTNAHEISIPKTVTEIGGYAFADCKALETLDLPEDLDRISTGAFYGCEKLSDIEIPSGVSYIGVDAFHQTAWRNASKDEFIVVGDGILYEYNGSAVDVVLPEEVKTVSNHAFENNTQMKSLNTSKAVSVLVGAFMGCEKLEKVEIMPELEKIESAAFKNCTALKEIDIPDTVKELGDSAFSGCTSLGEVVFPGTVEIISPSMFYNNLAMTDIFDLKSVKEIGDLAFSSSGLKSIKIPEGVERVGISAFNDCKYATYVTLPKSIKEIGDNAFLRCISLKDVYYSGTSKEWDKLKIGEENEMLTRANIYFADDIKITLNGEYISCDVKPFIESDRTLVPMRAIFEAMDADIIWDGEEKSVTATKGDKTIKLYVGSNSMLVNDTEVALDVAAKVVDDRTFIPARAVSEALDCNVEWDQEKLEVIITR